jgi:hypothetical protein
MTLILAAIGKHSLWMLSDRRLSVGKRPVRDDATKVMLLENNNGSAILGYAGLGSTPGGTQPSEWMSRVLRGRNLPIEQLLGVLTDAMRHQFYRPLARMRRGGHAQHDVVVPAFVTGVPKLFTISLVLTADGKALYRYTRHETKHPSGVVGPPTLIYAGSGISILQRNLAWQRDLRRMIKAHERGLVPPLFIADRLAALNYSVHLKDPFVGPNCIVTWKYGREKPFGGGGATQSYSRSSRDAATPAIPMIVGGIDMAALGREMMAKMLARSKEESAEKKFPTPEEMTEALNRLSTTSDDTFK